MIVTSLNCDPAQPFPRRGIADRLGVVEAGEIAEAPRVDPVDPSRVRRKHLERTAPAPRTDALLDVLSDRFGLHFGAP
jgi:hypothetical protein